MSKDMKRLIIFCVVVTVCYIIFDAGFRIGVKFTKMEGGCDGEYESGVIDGKTLKDTELMDSYNKGWKDGFEFKNKEKKQGKTEESFFRG